MIENDYELLCVMGIAAANGKLVEEILKTHL